LESVAGEEEQRRVPLFYLHTQRGGVLTEDPDGSDLPDVAAAREEALAAARDLWAGAIVKDEDLSDHQFVIGDETGEQLLVVPFTDALPAGLRDRLMIR
jgi:hypothetical protein